MNGFNYILSKQLAWAKSNKIRLVGSQISKGKKVYTEDQNDNLFSPLSTKTRDSIEKGNGGELNGTSTHSA